MALKDWSTTPGSNATISDGTYGNISNAEGMNPNLVNDSARATMAHVRNFYETLEWRDWGGTAPAYSSGTVFTVASAADLSSIYTVGRRVRITESTPSTFYGIIITSVYAASTQTVTVALDSGAITAAITAVALGFDPTNSPIVRPVYGIRAYRTSNQTHNTGSSGTWDKIEYDVVTNGYNHGTTLNTSTGLITLPAWAAYFKVNATTAFASDTNGIRAIALSTTTNTAGTGIFEYGDRINALTSLVSFIQINTGYIPAAVAASFYVLAYQDSGSALEMSSDYTKLYVEFK